MTSIDQHLYRFEANGLGIYAAVERDCPRDDGRRNGKPDGSWLPRVGPKYPGAISLFTETGLAKYWGSGLMHWHASVTAAPMRAWRATQQGAMHHRDRFQIITEPGNVSFVEEIEISQRFTTLNGDIRGTIFWDFDGTLAVSSPLWGRAARAALEELAPKHAFDLHQLKSLFDSIFPWHNPHVDHEKHCCSETWWSWMEEIFRDCFIKIGAPNDVATSAATRVKAEVLNPHSYRVIDGAVTTLDFLRNAGWRHIIVSNHVPELESIVDGLGLKCHFDHVITSGVVGYEKPHRRMFDYAIELAGEQNKPMWMIGDNPIADIAGAKSLGIKGILFGKPDASTDTLQIAQLSQIAQFVSNEGSNGNS
jgi:putative hydrolase of the HAD superfamily